jgi:hypothetical protein
MPERSSATLLTGEPPRQAHSEGEEHGGDVCTLNHLFTAALQPVFRSPKKHSVWVEMDKATTMCRNAVGWALPAQMSRAVLSATWNIAAEPDEVVRHFKYINPTIPAPDWGLGAAVRFGQGQPQYPRRPDIHNPSCAIGIVVRCPILHKLLKWSGMSTCFLDYLAVFSKPKASAMA